MSQPIENTALSAFAAQLPRLSAVEAGGLLERACATWPQVTCEPAAFGAYLANQLRDGDVRHWHVTDLYLAWGALEGQTAALHTIDQLINTWVALAVRGRPGVELDEVSSRVRARMLVETPEKPAGLRQYTGQGALKAWVIVSALRATHDEARGAGARAADALELAEELAHAQPSAETRLHAAELRPHLRDALEKSLSALSVRLRTVMRLHYVDGVSADALARMYGVHRATTSRWLAEARQQVLDATYAELSTVLGPETLSSVKRELSHFEVSVASLFSLSPNGGEG